MKSEIYSKLYNEFVKKIPEEKIYTDELNRLAYGTDASFYRLIPEIVVKVKNTEEVQFILTKCNETKTPRSFFSVLEKKPGDMNSSPLASDAIASLASLSKNFISSFVRKFEEGTVSLFRMVYCL